jgi:hypothetical protein
MTKMLYPTILVAVLAIIGAVGLVAIDWYVWGTSVASRSHYSSIKPLTVRELAARFLGGVMASNTEVLMAPTATLAKVPCAQTKRAAGHESQGFKKVA